jgi:outer membrane lipoprotein-sorting protein
MTALVRWSVLAVLAALGSGQALAQTADDVIEKHLSAIGGRATLAKLETRVATGTIAVSAQGADVSGPLEVYIKAPNKSRQYFKLDLTPYGSTEMVVDRRCDGKVAFALNSLQGDREITGSQLQSLLNANFPSNLLNYKEAGAKVELVGKEKIGDRDAIVLLYTPKAGSATKQYFDAETYLLLRVVTKMNVPELGGEIEQTTNFADYRSVDGIKVPFSQTQVSSAQTVTVTLSKVEHNKPLDDSMFSRPVVK